MSIILKPISPKKLNISGLRSEVEKEMRIYGKGVRSDYKSTFETWSSKSKPNINTEIKIKVTEISFIFIKVTGEIYTYVHEGTEPHEIKVKNAKRLRFTSNYNAKTVIGQIKSKSGGSSGNNIYRESVYHPGFEGRHQTKLIKNKQSPIFKQAMQKAFDNWVKKSGHKL